MRLGHDASASKGINLPPHSGSGPGMQSSSRNNPVGNGAVNAVNGPSKFCMCKSRESHHLSNRHLIRYRASTSQSSSKDWPATVLRLDYPTRYYFEIAKNSRLVFCSLSVMFELQRDIPPFPSTSFV
jgi:hypothetical protein